jgi:hypothetical protein
MVQSLSTFEKSVYFYETTRRYIPEGCEMKSHSVP